MRALVLILSATALCALLAAPLTARAQSQAQLDQAIAQLEFGDNTLTGRPGATRDKLAQAGQRKGLFGRGAKTERVYTRNEPVTLIPYTPLVDAVMQKYRGRPGLVLGSLGELRNYTARVLTDDDGVFTFRGLKPGRYLLATTVRFEADITVRDDTGRTRTETTVYTEGYNITGASSITSNIYSYRDVTTELEHQVFQIVEVKADSAVTALGEME